ncbi:MAG: bifunctional folylpolyglutamate synthase/dihydrofolate synthase [Candidatus Cryptobacteroides sp.]
MSETFTEQEYIMMTDNLFHRFPSFQKAGASAYKPGIANMEFFDSLAGHPHRKYRIIHVAGTNGKGSVSNMLASVLSASGLRTGLYTSPHILDFRERMRIASPDGTIEYVSKEYVWDFVHRWSETFDHLDLSFFEITTMMALCWFADREVDAVVLETGLGGRLDSTNIVTPELSVITNIGLDHCDLLGDTLAQIAFEKAGIIKPRIPAVVGESDPQTDAVFERKVLYTNLPEAEYMGNRAAIMSLLTFADKVEPSLWDRADVILPSMDLQGVYQRKNLRTVLAAVDVLRRIGVSGWGTGCSLDDDTVVKAIMDTARRMDFHGRWEKLSDNPWIICDIGHNEHGLKYNFAQLESMLSEGRCTELMIIYGSVADKDVDAVMHLMPRQARYIFTNASSRRAMEASEVMEKYLRHCASAGIDSPDAVAAPDVASAVRMALELNGRMLEEKPGSRPLIYIGGSTYIVSEAVAILEKGD